jgi:hypothetical protein
VIPYSDSESSDSEEEVRPRTRSTWAPVRPAPAHWSSHPPPPPAWGQTNAGWL